MQKVLSEMQCEKSSSKWILDLMMQVQGILMESAPNQNDKAQFYCDILFISVVSLSGIDSMLMKQDLLVKAQNVRAKLFPQALIILSGRQDWKHAMPQVFAITFIFMYIV